MNQAIMLAPKTWEPGTTNTNDNQSNTSMTHDSGIQSDSVSTVDIVSPNLQRQITEVAAIL